MEYKHCKSKPTMDMIGTMYCTNLVKKEFNVNGQI